jgi:hypothetical protein
LAKISRRPGNFIVVLPLIEEAAFAAFEERNTLRRVLAAPAIGFLAPDEAADRESLETVRRGLESDS